MKKGRAPLRPDSQADLFGASASAQPGAARKPAAPHPFTATPQPGSLGALTLLNVRQAAFRLGLSKSTLDKWRCKGKGPRFIKSSDRAVRYDPADLKAWIDARRSAATANSP